MKETINTDIHKDRKKEITHKYNKTEIHTERT